MPGDTRVRPILSGNADALLALQVLMVDPGIGGLLLRGGTGTGKSLLARSAASLHPDLDPSRAVVFVPIGAGEDNLLGSHDVELMLGGGGLSIREGLLSRADGRILLIDDIGLHPDTNLDLVMEAAANGGLDLERDGISSRISTEFALLATWNPASGQLRPQLVDRFAISAEMDPLESPRDRLEGCSRALSDDPSGEWLEASRARIAKARRALPRVKMPGWLIPAAALTCSRFRFDGQRAEIATVRASRCIAALEGHSPVAREDLVRAAVLADCHRTRMEGAAPPPDPAEVAAVAAECISIVTRSLDGIAGDIDGMTDDLLKGIREAIRSALAGGRAGEQGEPTFIPLPCGRFPSVLRRRSLGLLQRVAGGSGREGRSSAGPSARMVAGRALRGRRVRMVPAVEAAECDILPTIRAALLARGGLPVTPIGKDHWRRWEKVVRPSVTAMLVVDASMSSQAYLQGLGDILVEVFARFFDPMSRVGLVAMTRSSAELVFSPTRNRRRVFGRVKDLVPGGFSPVSEALDTARRELLKARKLEGARNCFVLLVSDCYPEPLPPGTEDIYDSEPYRRVRRIASTLGRDRLPVAILDPMNMEANLIESMPGRRLARHIARATLGVLIPVPAEKITHKGYSIMQLLGAEQQRNTMLADQIASELDACRKTAARQPGGPIG